MVYNGASRKSGYFFKFESARALSATQAQWAQASTWKHPANDVRETLHAFACVSVPILRLHLLVRLCVFHSCQTGPSVVRPPGSILTPQCLWASTPSNSAFLQLEVDACENELITCITFLIWINLSTNQIIGKSHNRKRNNP